VGMRVLLDTNAYVMFKRNQSDVVETIVRSELILISPIMLGELMFGFRNGTRFKQNLEELNNFLEHEIVELAQIGKITSDRYSRIAAKLKSKGRPIPTNDIWIAAQSMEHGAELITSDKHFEEIDGLVYTIL
jgi:tRNA(fMet)-specific endonuclease VapC